MKFLFGDFVLVRRGFYTGIKGHLTDYNGPENKYYFEGVYPIGTLRMRAVNAWINEAELDKVEE